MFVKENKIKNKFRTLFLKLFNYIENNGNIQFDKNGEEVFINYFFELNRKKTINEISIFDIGANVGNYTQMLLNKNNQLQLNSKIHAFEPTKACFSDLQKKFAENKSVHLIKKAASDTIGDITIYYDKEKSGLASLYQRDIKAFNIEMNNTESIQSIRLDKYIVENAIEHIHLLKIDIEGHEMNALKGLGEYLNGSFIDFIQFEYGGANLDSHTTLADFYHLMTPKGFRIAKILRKGLELRSYHPLMDNFGYANYIAVSEEVIKDHEKDMT